MPGALSARNPRVSTLRRLCGRRSAREEIGRFVIDGPRLVQDALEAGVELVELFVPAGSTTDPAIVELIAAVRARDLSVAALAPDLFGSIAPTNSPQPALAVARTPSPVALEEIAAFDAVLVLVDIADPGNVGTLVRVAEAAGVGAVVACGTAVEWWNPKVVRASAGSLFRLPVAAVPDPFEVLDLLAGRGVTTVATVVDGSVPYTDLDYRTPSAFVLGSEAHGLPVAVAEACAARVQIPMAGAVESLNVAMAGAVCAFELARQRREARLGREVNIAEGPRAGSGKR